MVDEAKFSKPKTQELVDIVASCFVPVILAFTILTFAIWIAIGISVRHQNGGRAVVNAITYAISVLIVSCPCAIGLAIPMVVVISGGVAAKHGVVFKSAMAIETARTVSHVVFDKTGTLTQGKLSVTEEVFLSEKQDLATSITLGLTCDTANIPFPPRYQHTSRREVMMLLRSVIPNQSPVRVLMARLMAWVSLAATLAGSQPRFTQKSKISLPKVSQSSA